MNFMISVKKQPDNSYWVRVLALPHCGVYVGMDLTELEERAKVGIQTWIEKRESNYSARDFGKNAKIISV